MATKILLKYNINPQIIISIIAIGIATTVTANNNEAIGVKNNNIAP